MTEPLPQRGPTPLGVIKGPSLLTREKHGAKRSEWERFKLNHGADGADGGGNFFEDDNPFNDPFQYRPFKGLAFPPSDYIGPDDARETDDLSTIGANALRLEFAYGYCSRRVRSNLFYNADGKLVYPTAALGVVYDKETHQQLHFMGHDDDITALDIHPNKVIVCTGQMGKDPKVLIWSSRPEKGSRNLPCLCKISGDHRRAVIGLSFSSTGEYLATMGKDNNRTVFIYKWGKDKKMEDMRIGFDKGHNDDVYQLAYNPITDHVVAVGRKFIRFFGIKEGVEEAPSDSKDAKLSQHESKIWAKKGVFGRVGACDIMAVAFGSDGVTYAGAATGYIFRFAEQQMDVAVKAHPCMEEHARDVCKVTALWFDEWRNVLISSGDDGWIHMWDPSGWDPRNPKAWASYKPLKSMDFNQWVTPELQGLPIKMDDGELEKNNPKRGRPAAAHSLCGDANGNLLVGTVCNEIYEMNFDSAEPPFCYMQGHYDELWGLATHPRKNEFCTGAEDATLRVWDLEHRQLRAMAKIDGPIRCACYSPDGGLIAVGLGSGGKAKASSAKAKASEGKWLVLESEDLELKYEPLHTRHERVADIKFSPDGRWIAVANADNFIDVYEVPVAGTDKREFRKVAELKGHSSFVNHLDWSSDSMKLQSNCGAHELLYWRLWDSRDGQQVRWRPHQEKTSSTMRDEKWSTQSCIFGWSLRGIWPDDADGTDVNACARTNRRLEDSSTPTLLATADDFGKVKVFRYPCIVPRAACRPYGGHSSHVTNISFTWNDDRVISTGGDDRAVFQWRVVQEGAK